MRFALKLKSFFHKCNLFGCVACVESCRVVEKDCVKNLIIVFPDLTASDRGYKMRLFENCSNYNLPKLEGLQDSLSFLWN